MCACYVRLRDSWDNDVFARGFAVLDGRFVLDIEATDAEGRPTQVLILDLQPDWKTLAAQRPGRDGGARISARAVDKASRPRAPGFGLHRADPSTDVAVECSPATAVIHPPSRSVVRGAVRGCRRIIHSSRWEGSPSWSERQVLRVPTGTSAG
jgi:hypothetical protein